MKTPTPMTKAPDAGVGDARAGGTTMGRKQIPTDAPPTTLGHNPFAALQGVRASLPSAPASPSSSTSSSSAASPSPSPSPSPAPPPPREFGEKVVVRHERKGHGGKTVTVVSGVLPAARHDVADALKRALGCGARVDGDDVVLQGELVDRAIAFLQARGGKRIIRGS
jgi:translation initiation factor 1